MLPSHSQDTAAVNNLHRAGNTIQENKNVFKKQSGETPRKKKENKTLLIPPYQKQFNGG